MFTPRNYLIGSLVFHLSVIIVMAFASSHSRIIRKKFIVFGAHSRRNTEVAFKTFSERKKNKKNVAQVASRSKQKSIKKKKTKKIAKKPVVKKEAKKPKKIVKKKIKKTKPKVQAKKQEKKIKNIIEKRKKAKKVIKNEAKEKEPAKKTDQQAEEVEKFHIDLTGQVNKEMLVYQKRIQQEVQRLWRPPLGVPKGTVCTLLLEVGSDGSIAAAELVDRSKVLIYDLSVMKVAKKFVFHKTLWGKQFKIDFRQ